MELPTFTVSTIIIHLIKFNSQRLKNPFKNAVWIIYD